MNKQFNNDLFTDELARKVVKVLLFVQTGALIFGLIFTFTGLHTFSLFLAFITLVFMLGALWWANIRYQSYPIVKEKNRLNKKAFELTSQLKTTAAHINRAKEKREELKREEQKEGNDVLIASQNEYIRSGMINARIDKADIPGIGPGLKQRLEIHGFISAANISERVTSVEGFGPAKTQAIVNWHDRIHTALMSSKPTRISPNQEKIIKDKYVALQAANTEFGNKHIEQKTVLENNFKEIQPLIQELAGIGFGKYLRNAFHSRGLYAGLIGTGLIFTQLLLGTTSTFGAIVASIPTLTYTPTHTLTLTTTFTPSITNTETITYTPTITLTSTVTDTPTITWTPSKTYTPTRTPTQTPSKTLTRTITRTQAPYVPPVIPGGVYGNPWGFNFESGNVITNPPSNFCSYFPCINSFWNGSGYVIECGDGTFSKSGGRNGQCSQHSGYSRTLYSH